VRQPISLTLQLTNTGRWGGVPGPNGPLIEQMGERFAADRPSSVGRPASVILTRPTVCLPALISRCAVASPARIRVTNAFRVTPLANMVASGAPNSMPPAIGAAAVRRGDVFEGSRHLKQPDERTTDRGNCRASRCAAHSTPDHDEPKPAWDAYRLRRCWFHCGPSARACCPTSAPEEYGQAGASPAQAFSCRVCRWSAWGTGDHPSALRGF
jgi:hypothetical protein